MTKRRETEVVEASRHVFRQMTEIAESDVPPLIQEWGLINRLGKALKALDRESDKEIDWSKGARSNCIGCRGRGVLSSGRPINKGLHPMEPGNRPCPSCYPKERAEELRNRIREQHDWMAGEPETVPNPPTNSNK
tara:strand:+ start:506 stop:910 length:405 start_codon:yes stop_codon:yes gene_type:complete